MRYKHYSIAGKVRIFDDLNEVKKQITPLLGGDAEGRGGWLKSEQTKIWIILTQESIDNNELLIKNFKNNWITIIPRWTKSNLASCAHSLFDHYHQAEKSWINLLFVEKLPEEWIGYWIMNRVKRSAEV